MKGSASCHTKDARRTHIYSELHHTHRICFVHLRAPGAIPRLSGRCNTTGVLCSSIRKSDGFHWDSPKGQGSSSIFSRRTRQGFRFPASLAQSRPTDWRSRAVLPAHALANITNLKKNKKAGRDRALGSCFPPPPPVFGWR